MFDLLFKKAPTPQAASRAPERESPELTPEQRAARQAEIERQKKNDPLIGPKMGAKQINNSLIRGLRNPKGVHIESYLTALGALAGYSCQMSVRAGTAIERANHPPEENHDLVVPKGADGKRYYLRRRAEPAAGGGTPTRSGVSPRVQRRKWAPIAARYRREIFKHVAATVGGRQFRCAAAAQRSSARSIASA